MTNDPEPVQAVMPTGFQPTPDDYVRQERLIAKWGQERESLRAEVQRLTAERDAAVTWVPHCKNCGRAITRIDLPAPEGPDMKGMHGWLHVSPAGVFCPPYMENGEWKQPTVEPDDSAVCAMWQRLDAQRRQGEATLRALRAQIQGKVKLFTEYRNAPMADATPTERDTIRRTMNVVLFEVEALLSAF